VLGNRGFEDGLTGATVTVYLGCFNLTTETLGGAAPGEPLVNLADLLIVYKGFVDTQGYAVNPEEGTVLAIIECSSPMAQLNLARPFFTSREAMHQVDPTDTSFDEAFEGSKKLMHLWGKA